MTYPIDDDGWVEGHRLTHWCKFARDTIFRFTDLPPSEACWIIPPNYEIKLLNEVCRYCEHRMEHMFRPEHRCASLSNTFTRINEKDHKCT